MVQKSLKTPLRNIKMALYGKSRLQGFEKIYARRLFSEYLNWGVLGAWMTFKKAEMAKTLSNGLSMIETNPLNHIWSDLVILLGLSLNGFQKKLLLKYKNLRNPWTLCKRS